MRIDTDALLPALEICAAGKACASCPYDAKCLKTPYANAAMADAATFVREHRTRLLRPTESVGILDPVYIITDPPDIDTWMFYVGFILQKKLFIFRDPDGQVHDFREQDYGKTWLAFSGRVTDKEWDEAKKQMKEENKK